MEDSNTSMCTDDFKPRDYQEELLEIAIKKNTILYLPTGSGKTFVAIMLIRNLMQQIKKPYLLGGKRTFFLVNTVPLVVQQADVISSNLAVSVGKFSGDMNVDCWDFKKWTENLEQYEVLVMTSQILLDMLSHCYIQLETINLLIFDECHHAVEDHPMRQIMQLFEGIDRENQPRVLGLTATLLNSNVKPSKVAAEIENLEVTFHSTIATVQEFVKVAGFSTKPKEEIINYPETSGNRKVIGIVCGYIEETQEFLEECTVANFTPPKVDIPNTTLYLRSNKTLPKLVNSLLEDLKFHIQKLGPYGGSKAALSHLIQVLKMQRRAQNIQARYYFASITTCIHAVQKVLNDHMSSCVEAFRIFKYSSRKILLLIEIMRCFKRDFLALKTISDELHPQLKREKHSTTSCIIFVQRRYTAKILYSILKVHYYAN